VQHRMTPWQAILALALLSIFAAVSTASAAPVLGPEGSAFYTPPSPLPAGGHGELVWYRPAKLNLNVTLPEVSAWTVLYKSQAQSGSEDAVTGTVIVPKAKWTGSGARPVVSDGIGTQGIAQRCAPSKQMIEGTEYDGGAIIEALKHGYAVDITDYQGYTNGATPEYTAGKAEGQAVLDIANAATQIPGSGLTSANPTILWGYSQGGQAVGWAGELQPSYASSMKLIGVAAGGVPGNLQAIGEFDNASNGAGLELTSLIGLSAAYPSEFNLAALSNAAGLAAAEKAKTECALGLLPAFLDQNLSKYTASGATPAQLEKEHPVLEHIIEEQRLGLKKIDAPVYHYHGIEDEFVPVEQDVALHQAWCSLGVSDDFQLYPGEHLLTDPTAIPNVIKWIGERVAGKTAPSTCGLHAANATLPSNARKTPATGDELLTLPAWELSGKVTSRLGLSVELPKGSTLTAAGDLTTGKLVSTLSIPPINETMDVLGIPITVAGALTPVGPATGTVGFTEAGVLSESAAGEANERVKGVKVGLLNVPIGCETVTPIKLPLSISEPANALAVGGFNFKTEVTVPPFGGCGILGPTLTAVESGGGNTVEIEAKPPAPINW
jgi:pimeloyl-ACP methyl ester carboxylesterase